MALLGPILSAIVLTFAFAPTYQFYLAWIGLIPWLLFVAHARSQRSAFLASWIGGTVFFIINMWWMANITVIGMIALMIYLGLYWGVAALVIRGGRLMHRGVGGLFCTAAVWVCFEYARGRIMTGLPWLFLGHTQSPILPMCQIADITGVYGISFWLVAVNASLAWAWMHRKSMARVISILIPAAVLTLAVLGYGIFRMRQTARLLTPGPVISVIQANYPQSNTGSKGATASERFDLHMKLTDKALQDHPDMVVWSETMVPPINAESRALYAKLGSKIDDTFDVSVAAQQLSDLAASHHVALLIGGEYQADYQVQTRADGQYWIAQDRRNTAYYFDRNGVMSDAPGFRYDKVHLVPWGEFIPFKDSIPLIYHLMLMLGPPHYEDYQLSAGSMKELTVFHLPAQGHIWRFVTPICFEDIDARICAAMFRPAGNGKRADFIVNLTNDGWFRAGENAQHLQAALFRSIENRAWTARSVNMGISAFVDSEGRVHSTLPVRTIGELTEQLFIDPRITFYTLFGDIFAGACIVATVTIAAAAYVRRRRLSIQLATA